MEDVSTLLKEIETAVVGGRQRARKGRKLPKEEEWFCVVDQKAVRFQSRQHFK
jgi:hypothetical protein